MRSSLLAILLTSTMLGSVSFANTVENMLVGPGIFPTQPSDFIKCVAEASIAGSKLQFLGLGTVNLLESDNSRIVIQFLAKNDLGENIFLNIIANSTDEQKGWQKISASNNNTYYFSSSVSSVALVRREGGTEAAVFDFANCQN